MSLDRLARKALVLFRLAQIVSEVLDATQKNQNHVNRSAHHQRRLRKPRHTRLPHTPRKG